MIPLQIVSEVATSNFAGSPGIRTSIAVNVELFFAFSFLGWWSNAKRTNSQECSSHCHDTL